MNSNKYEKAVAALIANPTAKEAAKAAGIGESTLRSYKSDPEFMELYTAARHELIDAGVKTLQDRFSDAVETMCQIMQNREVSPNVRLSAANSIIQNCVRLTEETERMARAVEGHKENKELLDRFFSKFYSASSR